MLANQKILFDRILQRELERSIADLDGTAPLLARMAQFHLGWIETDGGGTTPEQREAIQGKRMRPHLAFLTAAAVHGDPERIGPIAAAIELLHNFTLIHDDIQDRSPNRRHRATVWRIWGDAQAINAGDAMFAAAQRSLLRTDPSLVPPQILLQMVDAFNAMTIDIVRGQTLDIEFERSVDVSPDAYLTMIRAKTAAIVRFAAWIGARASGTTVDDADLFADFGGHLGVGFQVRDDVLGIWGPSDVTGKDRADDIRRRKKSLPVLLFRQQASESDLRTFDDIYNGEPVDEQAVDTVLELMDAYQIERRANAEVARYHQLATGALDQLSSSISPDARRALNELVHQLDDRTS